MAANLDPTLGIDAASYAAYLRRRRRNMRAMFSRLGQGVPELQVAPCADLIALIQAGGWLVAEEAVPANSDDSYNRFYHRNKAICIGYEETKQKHQEKTDRAKRKYQEAAAREQAAWEAAQAKRQRQREAIADQQWRESEQQRQEPPPPEPGWPAFYDKEPRVWITIGDLPCYAREEGFSFSFDRHQKYLVPNRIAWMLIQARLALPSKPGSTS